MQQKKYTCKSCFDEFFWIFGWIFGISYCRRQAKKRVKILILDDKEKMAGKEEVPFFSSAEASSPGQ